MNRKEPHNLLGTWCEVPSALAVSAVAKTGLDFVVIDLEHGAINLETVQNMVFAAQAEKTMAIVRVSENKLGDILPVMDTGVDGLMIPHISNANDLDKIIEKCKFYPDGHRGFNPFTRSCQFQSVGQEYLDGQNQRQLLCIIIEDAEGLENIEELASNKHVDVVYLGQYDLSISLGIPGQIEHPLLTKKLAEAVVAINRQGKMAGCMVHTAEQGKAARQVGYRFIMYKVDVNVLFTAYQAFCDDML